jgi:hypothetical protein
MSFAALNPSYNTSFTMRAIEPSSSSALVLRD